MTDKEIIKNLRKEVKRLTPFVQRVADRDGEVVEESITIIPETAKSNLLAKIIKFSVPKDAFVAIDDNFTTLKGATHMTAPEQNERSMSLEDSARKILGVDAANKILNETSTEAMIKSIDDGVWYRKTPYVKFMVEIKDRLQQQQEEIKDLDRALFRCSEGRDLAIEECRIRDEEIQRLQKAWDSSHQQALSNGAAALKVKYDLTIATEALKEVLASSDPTPIIEEALQQLEEGNDQ